MVELNTEQKKAKLQNAMSRAKKLIQLESNGTLDKIASRARDEIKTSLNEDSSENINLHTTMDNSTKSVPKMGSNAMNVPAAIRESFSKNPNISGGMYPSFEGQASSDLDFLLGSSLNEKRQKNKSSKKIMVEETEVRPKDSSSQQIDYPMIRTIVEEIVRKYSLSLKNKILSEDTAKNELSVVTIGKGFKFLDSKGNIYEAKLTKLGNINNRKGNVIE